MRIQKIMSLGSLFSFMTFAAAGAFAGPVADPSAAPAAVPVDADNSRMNKTEAAPGELTADQAKNNLSDQEIMQAIRKSVVQDKSLSTYAHNVKIISQQGQVTLKGTVHSSEEKARIGEKASAVVGEDRVTNRISVKGS